MKWSEIHRHVWLFATPWGFSVHGVLQAKILEGIAVPSFRGSSQPRDQTLWMAEIGLKAPPDSKVTLIVLRGLFCWLLLAFPYLPLMCHLMNLGLLICIMDTPLDKMTNESSASWLLRMKAWYNSLTISPCIWTFKFQIFKDAKHAFHQYQAWVKLQLALCLLLLMTLQLYHLPPPLYSVSNSSGLFTQCQLLCYITVHFKVLYCKI